MGQPAHRKNFRPKEPKEFAEEVLKIDRVTRVVAGGRRLRFRATVAVGNKRGKVGIGIGKSNEVAGAIQKAITKAKKNLITVPIYKDSIPHEVKIKFKGSQILMIPASEGTGIIAGGAIRKIVKLTGVKNIFCKRLGTTNKIANARGTMLAFSKLIKIENPNAKKVSQQDSKKLEDKNMKKGLKPKKKIAAEGEKAAPKGKTKETEATIKPTTPKEASKEEKKDDA